MTTTGSTKENGRTQKGKRRSVSNATSPTDDLAPNGIEQSSAGSGGGGGRGGKRVRDEPEEGIEEKKPRGTKKSMKPVDENEGVGLDVDGDGDGDEDGGDTRCVCGKGDSDEGGLMVMCETCKVWQHTQCMEIPEDDVPEHYYCELCEPSLHTDLLKRLNKQRRPRRRSSATRTLQKPLSQSPSPPVMPKVSMGKRRNTMNSRATTYEEEMALAIQASKMENGEQDEDDEVPVVIVGPRKKRKRSEVANVSDPDPLPPSKRSRSASVTSEQPAPIQETTPSPDNLEVPEQPPAEPSDEEVQAPVVPTTRNKRGGGSRKNPRKLATPTPLDENDEPPTRTSGRGRQPNQYSSRRGGHNAGSKRGGGNHGAHEANKRTSNANNSKAIRPASPPPFLTNWQLPDHLTHLSNLLPSEIPQPLNIRTGAGPETIQERGVKVKWPTKRMTIGDMNKRVRNMLEYVTREQVQHIERQARVAALEEALASGRYKPLTPDPSDSMDVDAMALPIEEDIKPTIALDGQIAVDPAASLRSNKASRVASVEPASENPTIAWMKLSTDEMLAEFVSGLLSFQERYRPRNRRHGPTAMTT